MPMTNKEVAAFLERVGEILEIRGENVFKARAYYSAARTIESLGEDVSKIVADGELDELPGFGEALTEKVSELVRTGQMKYYDEITADLPEGIFELLDVGDVGPKKVKLFYDKLGIGSVAELEAAARSGALAELPGMGDKSQAKILAGIEQGKEHRGRWLLSQAVPLGERIVAVVEKLEGVKRVSLGGSIRRRRETVGDIDVLVSSKRGAHVIAEFTKLDGVERVLASGDTKGSAVFSPGIQADLRVVEDKSFATALHYFTGSKEHNVRMRQLAKDRGWKLNEYGLFDGDKMLASKDEKALFAHFGMDFIEPELREDTGEIEAALKGALPDLVESRDIRGALHVHSDWSDGRVTIEELAREAVSHGFSYMTISDHSQFSHGLDEKRLGEQWKEIDRVRRIAGGIDILRSCEIDIMKDGSLDIDDETLQGLECGIASVHGSTELGAAEQTRRIIAAVSNRYVDILGHPSQRLLPDQGGMAFDVEAVLSACAARGVAVEISADPMRLDLDWRYIKTAKALGCKFAIGLDAHEKEHFGWLTYGVSMARKGWLEKGDILNTLTARQFRERLGRRRKRRKA